MRTAAGLSARRFLDIPRLERARCGGRTSVAIALRIRRPQLGDRETGFDDVAERVERHGSQFEGSAKPVPAVAIAGVVEDQTRAGPSLIPPWRAAGLGSNDHYQK